LSWAIGSASSPTRCPVAKPDARSPSPMPGRRACRGDKKAKGKMTKLHANLAPRRHKHPTTRSKQRARVNKKRATSSKEWAAMPKARATLSKAWTATRIARTQCMA